MDATALVEIATSLGTAVLVLWQGGRFVGRIEAMFGRHVERLDRVERAHEHLTTRVDEHGVELGEIRGKLASLHD